MMDMMIDIGSGILIVAGSLLILVGAIGLVRMPDLFTRMHAAGIVDSCGAALMFTGLLLQAGFGLVGFRLVVLYALFVITGPVATHALARAALHAGVVPKLAADRRGDSRDQPETFREAAQ